MEDLKQKYTELYDYMAMSKEPENMKAFGRVMTSMMDEMIQTNPTKAEEYISRLECIKWDNYLTPKEAEAIVAEMVPKAPWSRDQWQSVMNQHSHKLEDEPCYNRCALWVVMNMVMSDSKDTLEKYIDKSNIFEMVYDLALDKLCDDDKKFSIRKYFDV
jgi:hypothetical protein